MNPSPKTALSFVDKSLTAYCEASTSDEPPVCQMLREAAQGHPKAHWISGPLVGTLLKTLVSITQAKRVLDIGTFLGYSAAYMASARSDCEIISLECNAEFAARATTLIAAHPIEKQIQIKTVSAEKWLSANPNEQFDLIFFDSDRTELMSLFDPLLNAVKDGGVLVMDNACLRGTVLSPQRSWEHATVAFNAAIQRDPSLIANLLPVRDGILIVYKLPRR